MPTLYSQDRILVTHAGALPRPADVRPLVLAKSRGETIDQAGSTPSSRPLSPTW